jgi:hypothetical protein
MFQCGVSGQLLLVSGRVELSRPDEIRLRPDASGNQRPDGKDTRPDVRDLSACFQCSARPEGINTLSGRGPHRSYI